MSARRNWLRLYRWARASRAINPNLQADMLSGLIKPAPCLIEMLDRMNDMNKYNVRISYNNNGSADESHHIVYSETRSNAISQARKEFKTARREYMKIKIGKISAVEVICG